MYVWQLGLARKNVVNYDLNLVGSEPSDVNTSNATLISDDTEETSHKSTSPEMAMSVHMENEVSAT